MNKHRLRLLAIFCLAALIVVTFTHIVASSSWSLGGSHEYIVTPEDATYVFNIMTDPGDHISASWEWIIGGFRPVFDGGEFYLVERTPGEFDLSTANVLFHGVDSNSRSCCSQPVLDMMHPFGIEDVSLVWVLDYAPGWAPTSPPDSAVSVGPLELEPTPASNVAQERELTYIEAFLGAAGLDGPLGRASSHIQVTRYEDTTDHPFFIAAELALILAGIALWGASLAAARTPTAQGVVGLVQKGVEHLRSQLRLQILVGPMLLLVGAFGAEAIDNGGFGFSDPTGIADELVLTLLIGLWLLGISIWIYGLVRSIKALRHYNNTQEPDLGELGA